MSEESAGTCLDYGRMAREFKELDDSTIRSKLDKFLPYLKDISEGKVNIKCTGAYAWFL